MRLIQPQPGLNNNHSTSGRVKVKSIQYFSGKTILQYFSGKHTRIYTTCHNNHNYHKQKNAHTYIHPVAIISDKRSAQMTRVWSFDSQEKHYLLGGLPGEFGDESQGMMG